MSTLVSPSITRDFLLTLVNSYNIKQRSVLKVVPTQSTNIVERTESKLKIGVSCPLITAISSTLVCCLLLLAGVTMPGLLRSSSSSDIRVAQDQVLPSLRYMSLLYCFNF